MQTEPKEIVEFMNTIMAIADESFSHLTPPDVVFALECLKARFVQGALSLINKAETGN